MPPLRGEVLLMFMNSRKVRVPAKDMTFVISQFHASDRKQQEFIYTRGVNSRYFHIFISHAF